MPFPESPASPRPAAPLSRRRFLGSCAAALGLPALAGAAPRQMPELAGRVGLTTSSLFRQNAGRAEDRNFELWDMPRILREELDLTVIDINTGTLGSREPRHIERLRRAVDAAGCVITNLKVNATHLGVPVLDLPFASPDPAARRAALAEYKEWILAAKGLGARWLRPFPGQERPDFGRFVDGYRELADFAAPHGITLLVENAAWIGSDPNLIPTLIRALDGRIAAGPDIGSWLPEVRFEALASAFPHAVTCDFKVGSLRPAHQHPAYDLRRCFETGWQAGFRGPWCIEHGNANTAALFRELRWIKAELEAWTRAAAR